MSSDGSYADIDEYSAYSSSFEWFWNDDVEPTQAVSTGPTILCS